MKEELERFKYITAAWERIIELRKKEGVKEIVRSGKTKKIVALTCGSRNGMCETLVKEAAMGALELGMETEIIKAQDVTVKPCKACHACSHALLPDSKLPNCPTKDDVPWLMEKTVVNDSALIVAVPVFHLMSNSFLLNLCQRMHPTMFTHLEMLFNRKVAGIISVGGGLDGWTSLGMTVPQIWVQHFARVADQVDVQSRDRDTDWFARARELGRNVAKAMIVPIEEVTTAGEKSAFECPVCHCDVLQMPDEKPRPSKRGENRYKPSHVVCPICWVHGTLSFDGNNNLTVKWDDWDIKHSRFSAYGVFEHLDLIIQMFTPGSELHPLGTDLFYDKKRGVDLKKEYASFGTYIKP